MNMCLNVRRNMRQWIVNSSIMLGSVIVFLCAFEIMLRIFGFSYPNFYEYDDLVGHKFYPGTEGWYRAEGEAYISINRHGLRDREHTRNKPADTVRIAVFGDSYAEALQVPLAETFWAVMEQELNRCQAFGTKKIEVINFGVSGDGTAQELLRLQRDGWSYAPDIVLLAFLTGNDLRNNSKTLEPDKLRPFFLLQDGELVLDTSFVNLPAYRWKTGWLWSFRRTVSRYSRVLQFFNKLKILYDMRQLNHSEQIQGDEIGLDHQIYREPVDSDWQEAWKITESLLLKMRTEVEGHQARFVMVVLSNSIQVHPDPTVRKRFMQTYQSADIFYPDQRLESFSQREGIEVIPLAPLLQRYAEETGGYLHGFGEAEGFGHWNQLGHRIAGETISQYFCGSK